jgi:predicted transcriptional regulator
VQHRQHRIQKHNYDNEGITQDPIYFRIGFSNSKISMIMKKLEEKDPIVGEIREDLQGLSE